MDGGGQGVDICACIYPCALNLAGTGTVGEVCVINKASDVWEATVAPRLDWALNYAVGIIHSLNKCSSIPVPTSLRSSERRNKIKLCSILAFGSCDGETQSIEGGRGGRGVRVFAIQKRVMTFEWRVKGGEGARHAEILEKSALDRRKANILRQEHARWV